MREIGNSMLLERASLKFP